MTSQKSVRIKNKQEGSELTKAQEIDCKCICISTHHFFFEFESQSAKSGLFWYEADFGRSLLRPILRQTSRYLSSSQLSSIIQKKIQ